MDDFVLIDRSCKFQSTPSVRRETSYCRARRCSGWQISIHSLRAEGDEIYDDIQVMAQGISIHSLRAEGDLLLLFLLFPLFTFQSTPSVRRETLDSFTMGT